MSEFQSVPDMFLSRVEKSADREAYRYPDGETWKSLSWRQTGARVRELTNGLLSLGVQPEQRVAVLSATRIEWILADLSILCAGGATTTIYPANTPDECAYILNDCEAVCLFVDDQAQLAKIAGRRAELPHLKAVVVFDGPGGHGGWALSLDELAARGKAHAEANPRAFDEAARAVTRQSLATLIYTSGTTGRPKGVELVHDAWVYEAEAIQALEILSPDDLQYLWLPLAHVFGKVLEAAQLMIGFATAVDGRVDKLVENLKVVQPTFIAAVPRIFEKVYNKILGGAQEAGGAKLAIFKWALTVGKEASALRQQGQSPGGLLALKAKVADALVFKKVRAIFGGRLRYFISGSAPLSRELAEFFHAMGITILEGYGLTETSAASFVNRPNLFRFGTVGPPLPGTEVKIAEDGEILIRGRGVMRRYHGMPDATAEVLDAEGWAHTGDIGELDEKGLLKITDRKKDLIKTSGGKYVAPQQLEGKLILQCRYIAQALVHGNNRNFCTAIVTLNEMEMEHWAAHAGLGNISLEELAGHEKVKALIQDAVDGVNATLPRHETIKRFAILPREFTIDSGELTPSLKLKRRVVEKKHSALIDSFYEGALKEL